MDEKWILETGSPLPMGATLSSEGCNFSLHAPDAEAVHLCLYNQAEQSIAELPLPKKTGKVWHGLVKGIKPGQRYGYRVHGANMPQLGLRFDPQKLLIDPYAKRLTRPLVWNKAQYEGDSAEMIPKAVVCDNDFNWDGVEKPLYGPDEIILYETHVKGLTQQHPEVPKKLRGTYLGVASAPVIKHLQALGVTAVQLLPVMAAMPEPFITEKGLTNYWGYNTINYFSPDSRFAIEDPVNEFKTMVKTLHQAGIEVILDVVYNHTAESGDQGPTLSFKGIDNSAFYLFEMNEHGAVDFLQYSNNSGCGNSVDISHPYTMRLVLDSLRYWVEEMGVDGFRFDLAASLGRDPHEFSASSGFFKALRQDPVLQQAKLIAEPWDIGHGGYRLGHFPSNWHECNDKYRDNVRAFWRGDKGLTSEFATRLLGSRDVFKKGHRSIHSSVNFISYHDGFTLHDLVTFREKHNEANREQNRDGHGHNVSENYGVEGETRKPAIIAIRERQKRNLFTTLLLSQGIPHLLGGDELSRTQLGNNNAYCQDNEISWYHWKLNERKQDFLHFCQAVVALRKNSVLLRNLNLEDDSFCNRHNVVSVGWYRPDGRRKVEDDWHDADNQAFAVELQGDDQSDEHWLLLFNASDHDVRFSLPELSADIAWRLKLDTRYNKLRDLPEISVTGHFLQSEKSISVFRKRKK
ncbi:glycogen debranching protein GlgX [Planctobacterium marinum]|uniref:glycogen debranching protein GlgX n=1 Tax=Planctobacterium marinum TaxID=1631968 RepID=UPI001E646B09|nr:glycogen debranching protein GlgX [Planctobacterium marinum]MCC2607284.1 glycogen debranching protein GlgX [Planctobacterium marinum]